MNTIEERRDLVADLYAREGLSERAIAERVGVSPYTVHRDLEVRGVPRRSRTSGLNRRAPTAEQLERLQDGHRGYRAEVERVKVERGLMNTDELLERLRRAGVPRSQPAIVGYVDAGLIAPERDLGFAKPWLFTEASGDELARRLRSDRRDGRLRRFNPGTAAAATFRATWYRARHKSEAEFGRLAPILARAKGTRPGRRRELDAGAIVRIRSMAARGKSQRTIAATVGCSRGQVRRVLGV